MSSRVAPEDLKAALRLRYDFYSAASMFDAALARAGLAELPAYDHAQVRAFRAALASLGDRLTAVDAQLDRLLAGPPAAVIAPVAEPASPRPAPPPAAPVAAIAAPAAPIAAPAVVAPPAPTAAPAAARAVTLELTGLAVDDGTAVMVCGGEAYLGDWDPSQAIPLARTGDTWSVSLDVAPGTPLAFKFLQRRADGEVIWEGGDNRTAKAAPRIASAWR